jgi:5-methylcytosine-specific restriction endonuclease McrA
MEKRICIECNKEKYIDMFYGDRNQCKDCLLKKQKLQKKYSFRSRLASAIKSQIERFGIKTDEDTLSFGDLEKLLDGQHNRCCVCGEKFTLFEWVIGHIVSPLKGGHLRIENIQLQHQKCNYDRDSKAFLMVDMESKSSMEIKDDLIKITTH